MPNGTRYDLKKVRFVVNDIIIPTDLIVEAPDINPPQNQQEIVGGANAGGFGVQVNNNVDGTIVLKLFNRGEEDRDLEVLYNSKAQVSVYMKDENVDKTYLDTNASIGNMSSYSPGRADATIEFTFNMPNWNFV